MRSAFRDRVTTVHRHGNRSTTIYDYLLHFFAAVFDLNVDPPNDSRHNGTDFLNNLKYGCPNHDDGTPCDHGPADTWGPVPR